MKCLTKKQQSIKKFQVQQNPPARGVIEGSNEEIQMMKASRIFKETKREAHMPEPVNQTPLKSKSTRSREDLKIHETGRSFGGKVPPLAGDLFLKRLNEPMPEVPPLAGGFRGGIHNSHKDIFFFYFFNQRILLKTGFY